MKYPPPARVLPYTMALLLQDACRTQNTKARPDLRIEAIDNVTEQAMRLYPSLFREEAHVELAAKKALKTTKEKSK